MSEASARILAELHGAVREHPAWRAALAGHTRLHIAVMSEPFLSYVLVGKKTVESRFSVHRIAPYSQVEPGDLVLMKAGDVIGCFIITWTKLYDLAEHPLEDIAVRYNTQICADDDFWLQKASKRYVTLMGIRDVWRLPPVRISKTDRRAWVTLEADTSG